MLSEKPPLLLIISISFPVKAEVSLSVPSLYTGGQQPPSPVPTFSCLSSDKGYGSVSTYIACTSTHMHTVYCLHVRKKPPSQGRGKATFLRIIVLQKPFWLFQCFSFVSLVAILLNVCLWGNKKKRSARQRTLEKMLFLPVLFGASLDQDSLLGLPLLKQQDLPVCDPHSLLTFLLFTFPPAFSLSFAQGTDNVHCSRTFPGYLPQERYHFVQEL